MNTTAFSGRLIAATAAIGAILGISATFIVPAIYRSTVYIRLVVPDGLTTTRLRREEQLTHQLNQIEPDVLNRDRLEHIITALSLYLNELSTQPIDDLVEQMRTRDIQISILPTNEASTIEPAIVISFLARKPEQAHAATLFLAQELMRRNTQKTREQTDLWRAILPQPPQVWWQLEMPSPPSSPRGPESPDRIQYGSVGLIVGLGVGLLLLFGRASPTWTTLVAVFVVAGVGVATLVSQLLPAEYTSFAQIQFAPAPLPLEIDFSRALPIEARLNSLQESILSTTSLEGIITNSILSVNQLERERLPADDVINRMRRQVHIRMLSSRDSTFVVSFSSREPTEAQRILQVLVARLIEENAFQTQQHTLLSENATVIAAVNHGLIGGLDVIQAPTWPVLPITRNPWVVSFSGGFVGLWVGLALWKRASTSGLSQ